MRGYVLGVLLGVGILNSCALPSHTGPQLEQQWQSGQLVDAAFVSDFIIQKINKNSSTANHLEKDTAQKAWYQWGRSGQSHPDLQLNDVRLKNTQTSVLIDQGVGAVLSDYNGSQIPLVLQGNFRKTKKLALESADFAFQYEWPLLHQTFLNEKPVARVLLDQSLLLEVISVSESEIEAVLHTQSVPDLYLKGSHRLSIEYGGFVTEQWISIGEPKALSESLSPRIEHVDIVNNDQQQPALLLLKGQHFMLYPKYAYAMVDDQFVFGYQTEVFREGNAQTRLHVPENFDPNIPHTLMYATPFGTQFFSFGGTP